MDTEIAYNWLEVWVDANHPSFKNCIIDTSDNLHDGMNHVMEKIIEEAITTTDPDIIGILSMLDAEDEENSKGMCNMLNIILINCPYILLPTRTLDVRR
jgi:hypothetical protein